MKLKDMNVNSNANQKVKGHFVGQNVLTCVSMITDYILRQNDYDAPFNWDDVENYFTDNSEEIEELEEELDNITDEIEKTEEEFEILDDKMELTREKDNELADKIEELEQKQDDIQEKIDELRQEEDYPNEVYEWWKVDTYLLNKLQEKGEVVIPHMNIWGRCTSGQAILLDYVISEICYDLNILEGQENHKYWINR